MRAFSALTLVALLFVFGAAPVYAVVIGPSSAQTLQNALQPPNFLPPATDLTLLVPEGVDLPALLTEPIPNVLTPIEPAEAVSRGVAGATGGLVHPACVAETARRAALHPPQPPPHGDFPCIVPTSNSSGIVEGVCFVHECRGVASTGLDGLLSALSGLSSLSSMVSSILSNLLQPKPSSPSDGTPNTGVPSNTPPPQSTPLIFTSTPLTELDMSKLFNDSAIIVRNLLGALNPPQAQSHQ